MGRCSGLAFQLPDSNTCYYTTKIKEGDQYFPGKLIWNVYRQIWDEQNGQIQVLFQANQVGSQG